MFIKKRKKEESFSSDLETTDEENLANSNIENRKAAKTKKKQRLIS